MAQELPRFPGLRRGSGWDHFGCQRRRPISVGLVFDFIGRNRVFQVMFLAQAIVSILTTGCCHPFVRREPQVKISKSFPCGLASSRAS